MATLFQKRVFLSFDLKKNPPSFFQHPSAFQEFSRSLSDDVHAQVLEHGQTGGQQSFAEALVNIP